VTPREPRRSFLVRCIRDGCGGQGACLPLGAQVRRSGAAAWRRRLAGSPSDDGGRTQTRYGRGVMSREPSAVGARPCVAHAVQVGAG